MTTPFFVKDLGLALEPKMCLDQSQAFKEVNNGQAFTVGRKKINLFFFQGEPLPGASRHVCAKFRANIRRTNCVHTTNIRSNLTPEIEYTLKPSNCDAQP